MSETVTKVNIPLRDFSGLEDIGFALVSGMFYLIFLCYSTNYDETKRRECVIAQATHGISKAKETFIASDIIRVQFYFKPGLTGTGHIQN